MHTSDPGQSSHVLWVAEAALGRLRRNIPGGGLVDDGEGFAFCIEDPRELERIVSELTAGAAFGTAPIEHATATAAIEAVSRARREGLAKLHRGPEGTPRMGAIAMPPFYVAASMTGDEARRTFLADETLSALVYVDLHRRPVGLLQRERLFRMTGGQYGYALYANRPVLEAADREPWTMGAETSIVEAARSIATRDAERLSDDILLVDAFGRVLGIVRLRDLLRALTSLGLETAGMLNHLTGLPSAARTEMALAEMLDTGEALVVSRVDIRDFKTWNELAGFTAGDRTIQALGHAVAEVSRSRGLRFIGHTGGDDFIVAWNDTDEAIVGAIEIGVRFLEGLAGISPIAASVPEPELAVSTLILREFEVRDAATLANRLATLKEVVRKHGGGAHAIAHVETIATPAWRPLDRAYLRLTDAEASVLGR